jgi:hypothetical protein
MINREEPTKADDRQEERSMNDDYLWDASGEPEPEVQQLERVLSRFRHTRPAPIFPAVDAVSHRRKWAPVLPSRSLSRLAVAAIIAIAIVSAGFLARNAPKVPPASRPAWDVARVSGAPKVGPPSFLAARTNGKLQVGQLLETDGNSRASITSAELGQIDVDPGTRLRLLESAAGRKRIALDRGTIHARIWAPPGEFVVDTPSALAVDLGCIYTLQVDDDGSSLLRTTLGWVGFRLDGRESFIPAGAACLTRANYGPGTPFFEDAPEALRAALLQLDFGPTTPDSRHAALHTVLSRARSRDALTLWHLLSRTHEGERQLVYDRLATLAPPPPGVTRDAILQLDSRMLDLWWNALDFGDINVWRHWERSWTEQAPAGKTDR